MKTFNNMNDLKAHIMNAVTNSMDKEVLTVVRAEERQAIQDVVYDAGAPRVYKRRYDNHGLRDERNIVITDAKTTGNSVSILIQNNTTANIDNKANGGPGYSEFADGTRLSWNTGLIDDIVEYGGSPPYDIVAHLDKVSYKNRIKQDAWWSKPRPFTQETINRLKDNEVYVDAVKVGLNRQGIKTEQKGV